MATPKPGLSLAGKAFFGSLTAGTFVLGVWQTQRYLEKSQLVQERHDALQQAPTTHLPAGDDDAAASFRRVQLSGRYDHSKTCLVGPRGPPLGALPDKPGYASQGMAVAPQGYLVLTPFQVLQNNNDRKTPQWLWVNRGWIPSAYVPQNQRRRGGGAAPTTTAATVDWSDGHNAHPTTTTTSLTCIPSQTEKPRVIAVDHQMELDPPQLFWLDLQTLQAHAAANLTAADNDEDNFDDVPSDNNNNDNMPLVTAVTDDLTQDASRVMPPNMGENNRVVPVSSLLIVPPAAHVGDFKTSPAVHASYAATWYSLSIAGVYMTRLLLQRHP